MSQSKELARRELSTLLDKSKRQIEMALPKSLGLSAERMCRMAITLFSQRPELGACDPLSIVACVIQSSELGLELTGPLGHAWMVPYKGQATFQVGYKGFIELGFRSNRIQCWPFRTVFANDKFNVRYGTDQALEHVPAMEKQGDAIGYYSILYFKDGGRDFHWMSVEECAKHRDKFAKFKGPTSVWAQNFDAMAMKTTVRMLAKRAPLSPEIQKAVTFDEYGEADIPVMLDLPQRSASDRAATLLAQHDAAKPATQATKDQIVALEMSLAVTESAVEAFMKEQGWEPEKLSEEQGQQVLVWLQEQEPAQTT